MKKYTAILVLALGLISFSGLAQIRFNNIGAGVSYWNRSYSGNDERSLLRNYDGEGDFKKGGAVPFITAEIGIWRGLGVDGRVGLWNADFESEESFGDGLVIAERMEQTIIPVSVGLIYRMSNMLAENFDLYAGVGLNRYFIENKVSRDVTGGTGSVSPQTFSGNNYGTNYKAGLEYYFSDALGIGLEGRYNTGSYNQNQQAIEDAPVTQRVISLKGTEIGLSLKYRFNATPAPAEGEMQNVE